MAIECYRDDYVHWAPANQLRTDVQRVAGFKYIHRTAHPSVFVIRIVAKLAFISVVGTDLIFDLRDMDSVIRAHTNLQVPMYIAWRCIEAGDTARANAELCALLMERGIPVPMGW